MHLHWGTKRWRDNYGRLHRLDGPAVIGNHGSKYWYVNGLRHRIDGPAIIKYDGKTEWWVNGNQISNEVEVWLEEQNVIWPLDEPTQMLFLMKFG